MVVRACAVCTTPPSFLDGFYIKNSSFDFEKKKDFQNLQDFRYLIVKGDIENLTLTLPSDGLIYGQLYILVQNFGLNM